MHLNMKRIITITESKLRQIIGEAVTAIINENWNSNPKYAVEDEATGGVYGYYQADELEDAINDANAMTGQRGGRYLVRDCETDEIVNDTEPGVSYKF